MAMNSSFFFLLLYLFLLTGWHVVGGTRCSEEACYDVNRKPCRNGENFCGECLEGYAEDGNECIALPNDQENEDWENELAGTDGSDLTTIFEATPDSTSTEPNVPNTKKDRTLPYTPTHDFIPTTAPATGVEEQEIPKSNQNHDDFMKNKPTNSQEENAKGQGVRKLRPEVGENKKNDEIENVDDNDDSKHGHSRLQSTKQKDSGKARDEVARRLRIDQKARQQQRDSHKKREEEKLNKFLGADDEQDNKSGKFGGKILNENQRDTNLQINSTTNPPPFIKKHKVGKNVDRSELDDIYFLFIVIGCSVAGIAGLALAGYCWYKLHTTAKAVSEAEYAGYGMKGSTKQPSQVQGDQKLDYSAEMYHYHQTKSQLAAMEKAGGSQSPKGGNIEDEENSDEGDEGDYTVYECPGLAPTGDMTVVNPLFSDQEVIGSDQDANGDRSGHSSPTAPRHTTPKTE